MNTILKNLECWEAIVTKFEEASPVDLAAMTNNQRNVVKENRENDSIALWHIYNALEDAIFLNISIVTTAR